MLAAVVCNASIVFLGKLLPNKKLIIYTYGSYILQCCNHIYYMHCVCIVFRVTLSMHSHFVFIVLKSHYLLSVFMLLVSL